MKLSLQTTRVLSRLGRLGDRLLIADSDSFTVFGDGAHDGMVTQGQLENSFPQEFGVARFGKFAGNLKNAKTITFDDSGVRLSLKNDQQRPRFKFIDKAEFEALKADSDRLLDLFDTKKIGTFFIGANELKLQKKVISLHRASHIRFLKTAGEKLVFEVFDIRTQFDEDFYLKGTYGNSFQGEIDRYEGSPFAFAIKAKTYSLLMPSDYEVTVFENGIAEFVCMAGGISYLMRDQRIGKNFEIQRPTW